MDTAVTDDYEDALDYADPFTDDESDPLPDVLAGAGFSEYTETGNAMRHPALMLSYSVELAGELDNPYNPDEV